MGDTANPDWEGYKARVEETDEVLLEQPETLRELSLDEYIRITALECAVKSADNTWTTSDIIRRTKTFEGYIRGDE